MQSPCPNCGDQGYYHTYADGNKETGYCQRCGHETSTPSKRRDFNRNITVEKPLKQGRQHVRKNR